EWEPQGSKDAFPGVWPERHLDANLLRLAWGDFARQLRRRGPRQQRADLLDGHLRPQLALAHGLAGLLFEGERQLDQAEAVQAELAEGLARRDGPASADASGGLTDGIVRGQDARDGHGFVQSRREDQVAPELQRGGPWKVALRPPGCRGNALVLGQMTVAAGDDPGELTLGRIRPHRDEIGVET